MKQYMTTKNIQDEICDVLKRAFEFETYQEMADVLSDIFCEVENELRSSAIVQQSLSGSEAKSSSPKSDKSDF